MNMPPGDIYLIELSASLFIKLSSLSLPFQELHLIFAY